MLMMEWQQLLMLGALLAHVRRTDTHDLPQFVGNGSNVTVAVGRDASLTCAVHNLQTFKVAWLRVDTQTILTIAGHVITKNHRVAVHHGDGSWTLSLRQVSPSDGGRYMCQVNTEPMMSQTHVLHVVVPPDIDDDIGSGDVIVDEGDDVTLRCAASGTPPPNITWRREDSRHFRIDNKTFVSRWSGRWLNMSSVERSGGGAYFCIATNGVPPSVSKRLLLRVHYNMPYKVISASVSGESRNTVAPSIWAHPLAARALAGTMATLQCVAEGDPAPQVHWTLNGEQRLNNGSKYAMSVQSVGNRHTATLHVARMSLADAGAYSCVAHNKLGNAQAQLFLHLMTTTTTTSTTTTTTTPAPATTTTIIEIISNSLSPYDESRHLEQLHRGVMEHPDEYIVLSQHQMQNLEMQTTM